MENYRKINTAIKGMIAGIDETVVEMQNVNDNKNATISAIQEISAISEEIAASTQELAANAEEQTSNVSNISRSTEELTVIAEKFNEIVQKFKI